MTEKPTYITRQEAKRERRGWGNIILLEACPQ
jgi:hypothetical protein